LPSRVPRTPPVDRDGHMSGNATYQELAVSVIDDTGM